MKISKVPLRLEPRLEGGYPVTSPTLHSLRIRGDREARGDGPGRWCASRRRPRAMAESVAPQTPEEEAALRELAAR